MCYFLPTWLNYETTLVCSCYIQEATSNFEKTHYSILLCNEQRDKLHKRLKSEIIN